jgi:hypothetical protein
MSRRSSIEEADRRPGIKLAAAKLPNKPPTQSPIKIAAGADADRWRPAVFAAVFVGALLVALGPIADGDIYWHLAAGREMLRRRAVLRVDPFTASAFGRPWVDVHWLFQLAVAMVYRAAGFVGLTVVKAVMVAAGAVIATRAAERSGGAAARGACAVTLLGLLFLARHLLPLRPVMVTLLFIAIFIHTLEAQRAAGARRALLWLPAVQVIWVNCQGLAPLGPALVASYLAGAWLARALARRRGEDAPSAPLGPLGVALGLTLLASCLTPYGLDALALPARLLARLAPGRDNVFGAAIAENVPPLVLARTAPEQIGHFRWVLLGLGLAFAVVRPRVHPAHALVLLGFAGLALLANRNVLLFYWVAAPLAATALAPRAAERWSALTSVLASARPRAPRWLARLATRARAHLAGAALAAALAAELGLAGLALGRESRLGAPTPFHFPIESARRLAALGAAGPIFAPDQAGGYLTFTVPALRPYIDTRLVLHTGREYADYLALFDDPARFDALAAAQGFRYVVLTTAYPDRYLGLVAHLAASAAWRLIDTDGFEVLFASARAKEEEGGGGGGDGKGRGCGDGGGCGARANAAIALDQRATIDAIIAELGARFGARPEVYAAARLNLARTLIVVGQPGQAEYVLSSLDTRAAALLRARGRFATGALASAESLTRILLLQDPRDTRSLTLMAELALAGGSADDGRRWLRQALEADPYDPEARSILAGLEAAAPPPSPDPADR